MLTISENQINKLMVEGFILCGDCIICPENITEQEKKEIESFGFEILN